MTSSRSSAPRRKRRLPKPRTSVAAFLVAVAVTAVIATVSLYGQRAVERGAAPDVRTAAVPRPAEEAAKLNLDGLFAEFVPVPEPARESVPPTEAPVDRASLQEPVPLAPPVEARQTPAPSIESAAVALPEPERPEPAPPAFRQPIPRPPAASTEPPKAKLPPAAAPSWLKYAVPTPMPLAKPSIVLVIDDLGLDQRRSKRVAELPGPLTLAYLPYAQDLRAQTQAARSRGHELLVHVPMEPEGADADPGPAALLTTLGDGEIRQRLSNDLGRFEGYVGVNNHMGSRFTRDRRGMAIVLGELQRRGLLFLDSRTSGSSVGTELAGEIGLTAFGRDVFLDHVNTPEAVRAALAELEAVARRKGIAVGIGHPHDVTYQALVEWLPTLEAKGLQIVPFSAMARQKLGEGGVR